MRLRPPVPAPLRPGSRPRNGLLLRRSRYSHGLLALALVCLAGCSRSAGPPQEAPAGAENPAAPAGGAPEPAAPGPARSAGGVRWISPARWGIGPERPMRVVTYRIPAAPGDAEDGECGVFFFGPGQGGGVEANLERWLGQFSAPGGGPAAAAARRERQAIQGLAVTRVDVSGTYLFSPTPMSSETTPKPGFRMLGAIVEAPEGSVFIKLTAPAATAAAAAAEFDGMLRSLAPG